MSTPGVLVTRPAEQAGGLVAALTARGLRALEFPVTCLEPLPDATPARKTLAALGPGDWLIPVSPGAVSQLHRLVASGGPELSNVSFAAVGEGTAAALEEAGWPVSARPEQGDGAEALLRSGALGDLAGRQVAICRGLGGRRVLDEALDAAGARVLPVELYRRVPADSDPARLRAWLERGEVAIICLSSASAAEHLIRIAGPDLRPALAELRVVAPSRRVLKLAAEHGLAGPACPAREAGDVAMAEAAATCIRREQGAAGRIENPGKT